MRPEPSDEQTHENTRRQLDDDRDDEPPDSSGERVAGCHGRQCDDDEHRRGIVESRLGLQDRLQTGGKRYPTQDREDGSRIGGGGHGAQQSGNRPVDGEGTVAEHCHDPDGGCRANRGQEPGRGQGWPDLMPPGREPTLGQDERQRGQPQATSKLRIVELHPEPCWPQHHADEQEEQQRRQPETTPDPNRQGSEQDDDRGEQQGKVEHGHGGIVPHPAPRARVAEADFAMRCPRRESSGHETVTWDVCAANH